MIADGGTINCFGKCHSIKLNMEEYLLDSPMISIQMGGVVVVLGVQWLQSSGTMAFNFQDIFMRFSSEGKEIEFRGIQDNPSKVISSNNMTKLIKKGHHGVISQLRSIDVQTFVSSTQMNLQKVINNHSKVFGEILKGLPHAQDHDHAIHLRPGSVNPVFHVSFLKKIIGDKILVQTIKKMRNRANTKYPIKSKKLQVEEATWEDDLFMQTQSWLSSVEDSTCLNGRVMLSPR
jgi:hypothetical protein